MTPMNDDGNDIPQAARALASKCDCGCGIVSVRLFDNDTGNPEVAKANADVTGGFENQSFSRTP